MPSPRSSADKPCQVPLDVPIVLYIDAAEPGGGAGYSVDLARGLRQRGYRVAALCHRADAVQPMRHELAGLGVEVHTTEGWELSVVGRLRRIQLLAGVLRRYPRCLLVLLIGNYRSGGPISVAARLGGVQAIVRADLQPPMPPVTLRHKLAMQLKDPFVDRFVVGADENRESFARHMGRSRNKVDVIHTGIDLDQFQPDDHGRAEVRAELGYAADALVVGTVSRLGGDVWRKGIPQFLDMAAQVAATNPAATFLVVGDGGARPDMEARAKELGLDERILFVGWRADLSRVYAAMDVFVMPSLFEGGPTTVLQAMAMAKPVVATRVGMVPEVIADGDSGLVVPPDNVPALANAVERLLDQPAVRAHMAEHAREAALGSFSIDVMVERYLAVLGRAIAPRLLNLETTPVNSFPTYSERQHQPDSAPAEWHQPPGEGNHTWTMRHRA